MSYSYYEKWYDPAFEILENLKNFKRFIWSKHYKTLSGFDLYFCELDELISVSDLIFYKPDPETQNAMFLLYRSKKEKFYWLLSHINTNPYSALCVDEYLTIEEAISHPSMSQGLRSEILFNLDLFLK